MDEKAIAGLLAEHERWLYAKYSEDRTTTCMCGALEIGNLLDREAPDEDEGHRAHVASVIAGYMADVWDEGWKHGWDHDEGRCGPDTCNPYRVEGNQP